MSGELVVNYTFDKKQFTDCVDFKFPLLSKLTILKLPLLSFLPYIEVWGATVVISKKLASIVWTFCSAGSWED